MNIYIYIYEKEIADLVNMVQVACVTQKAGRSTLPGSIASFNVLAIRHPAVAGQVGAYPFSVLVSDTIGVNSHVYAGGQMSVRAQPFSTYHGKICSDHVHTHYQQMQSIHFSRPLSPMNMCDMSH